MSGSITSPFLSPQELLAPREHNRLMQQTDAYVQNVALAQQKQERELEADDYKTIANTAGYLLSLPDEPSRAAAWSKIYGDLPDHLRARAPASYQGEGWAKGAMARAIPALEQWKDEQTQAANRALLGGGPGPAVVGSATGSPGTGGPSAAATVPPEYMPHFQEASARTGIPVETLIAQATQESGVGRASPNIMRILDSTARNPGFGMTGVDPASLRDPRANILFGADYLKARAGGGNMADPAVRDRALAAYNGGGDPNYVANVTRYLPAQGAPRGVAARTGGVDVAGPGVPASGPAAPPDAGDGAMAPDVRQRMQTLAGAGGPPNALGPTAPVPTPMAAPSAPAPAAAAPVASPAQIAAQLGIGPDGLTARDKQVLAANSRSPTAQLSTLLEGMVTRNRAAVQQTYEQQRQAASDALEGPTKQAALAKAQREAAAAEQQGREPLFTGQGTDNQDFHILRYSDPKTDEYHQAYARQATPKQTQSGLMVYPNMNAYRMPLDEDGVAVTTLSEPRMAIAPGDIGKLRDLETQAAGLKSALTDFGTAFKKAGSVERLKTVAGGATDLKSAWTNAAMLAKGDALFQLGVLSGDDLKVIRSALTDPGTFAGYNASTETVDKQITRINKILDTRLDQARRSYGGGMSTGGPAPAAADSKPADTGGPVSVKTASEAQALAPGTVYTTPDGRRFKR